NLHFGIREHAMGGICNGMALHGGFLPLGSTFLVFADYMRPAIRLAALSELQAIHVFTHDSVFLGEDGPTHQPIEHLVALRAIPNLHVVRPADGLEVATAWAHALSRRDGPTALVLTRQKPGKVDRKGFDPQAAARGGYLVEEAPGAKLTVMATGSELATAQAALRLLAGKGIAARLVSMPCLACFDSQPEAYRREVLPPGQRVCAVEAARGLEWWRHAGRDGLVVGIDRFGASAPEKALAEAYGFTPAKVAERIERWLGG
ncbi:MAG TPA: transketolase C-terminal domain-containing protein, partial [Anaeromyxobacteraceae bacterium]